MVEQVKRAIDAAYDAAPHGSRVHVPKLDNLISNITRAPAVNKLAESAVTVSVGLLALGGLDAARRFPLTLDAMICATQEEPMRSFDEIQRIETRIEGRLNDLQMAFACGDESAQTKQQMLDEAKRHRAALDELIKKLEQELYGGPPQ